MWSGLLANIPSGWALCNGANGTPDLRDRFIVGAANGANPGTTGGAGTHGHTVTQPADHAALSHAGTAVADHNVTQPAAHNVTQPAAHTDVLNHVHVERAQGGTTAATTGTHLMTSTATGGSLRNSGQSTNNPTTGGVASQVHTGTAVDAHSGTAVSAHGVTQPSNHAAQSHTGASVNSVSHLPPFYTIAFIQKL